MPDAFSSASERFPTSCHWRPWGLKLVGLGPTLYGCPTPPVRLKPWKSMDEERVAQDVIESTER